MNLTALICGLLLLAYGCASSQAAHQIQEGRLALLTGNPGVAVHHFEQAAALDSKNSGSPLQESAWTYVGRAYYGTMKYSLARQALDRALAQNKDDDVARLYVGLIGVREQMNETSRKQIQAGLQGVYDRVEYIKRFTVAGEFWDPSGQLSTELLALIKAVSAPQVDWSSVIPRVEQLGLTIENEVDQARRDELNRYRGGGSGAGDM
jgi:tetratricopeptide (TPR) repeat protein